MFLLGIFLSRILLIQFAVKCDYLHCILGVLLILPMAVDGTLQYGYGIMSTNCRRAITGGLAGIGAFLLIAFIKSNYNSVLTGDLDMVVTVVLQIISHLFMFFALKLELKKALKEKLSDEQRQVYAETYSITERMNSNPDLCFDFEYINDLKIHRSKMMLAATNKTCKYFERIYSKVIEVYEAYSIFCEGNDPGRDERNIEYLIDDNGVSHEFLHVTEDELMQYKKKCIDYKHNHEIKNFREDLIKLLNSMRSDLENDLYQDTSHEENSR